MTTVTSSVQSLGSSLLGIIKNIFESVAALFNAFFATGKTAVTSAFDLFKAIMTFLISNIFLMVIIAAGFFGYTLYLERKRSQKPSPPADVAGRPTVGKVYHDPGQGR